jgi:RimJ/RimL family protein N-acetyltransferase
MAVEAFVTERIRARRPEADDEPSYGALFAAPGVARWLRPPPLQPFALDDAALAIDADAAKWDRDGFGPCVLESRAGEFLGRGGLARATVEGMRVVEIAWALLPEHWGTGLATESAVGAIGWARTLGLDEVVAFTLPHNAASRRVMEKAGLVYDREVRHAGLPHVLYRLRLT